MKEIALAARRRRTMPAKPKAAIGGGTGRVMLVALLIASSAYVAFGGQREASSALAPETSVAWLAPKPADGDGAQRRDNAPVESVVIRCDKAAVAAANRLDEDRDQGRQWRRERQLAFRRCVDASSQSAQGLYP